MFKASFVTERVEGITAAGNFAGKLNWVPLGTKVPSADGLRPNDESEKLELSGHDRTAVETAGAELMPYTRQAEHRHAAPTGSVMSRRRMAYKLRREFPGETDRAAHHGNFRRSPTTRPLTKDWPEVSIFE